MAVLDRGMGLGLRALGSMAGSPLLDRTGLRTPVERLVFRATRDGFRTATAAGRAFTAARRLGAPARQRPARRTGLFDLTPTDEQAMLQEMASAFAAEVLRPAAQEADAACALPAALRAQAQELGLATLPLPEAFDGVLEERSAMTSVLVLEALAAGDPGAAAALMAPNAVAGALSLWGDEDQQARYLPSFAGDDPPVAALAIAEPRALFDPFELQTTATPDGDRWRLTGEKALVPQAADAELLLVAAHAEGRGPSLFLVEGGVPAAADPCMGLRATATARLRLDGVQGELLDADYAEAIHRSRLAWCAIAVGTAQAVLDYVIPYVKTRKAFGEPVAHRQGVAFLVSELSIDLESLRMTLWRAAARADQDRGFAKEAAVAWELCRAKAPQIGSTGVQLLGGHGYVKEHPVERWYRDLSTLRTFEGGLLV